MTGYVSVTGFLLWHGRSRQRASCGLAVGVMIGGVHSNGGRATEARTGTEASGLGKGPLWLQAVITDGITGNQWKLNQGHMEPEPAAELVHITRPQSRVRVGQGSWQPSVGGKRQVYAGLSGADSGRVPHTASGLLRFLGLAVASGAILQRIFLHT